MIPPGQGVIAIVRKDDNLLSLLERLNDQKHQLSLNVKGHFCQLLMGLVKHQ